MRPPTHSTCWSLPSTLGRSSPMPRTLAAVACRKVGSRLPAGDADALGERAVEHAARVELVVDLQPAAVLGVHPGQRVVAPGERVDLAPVRPAVELVQGFLVGAEQLVAALGLGRLD